MTIVFFGMRCASVAAEVLRRSDCIKTKRNPWARYFYPAKLRMKLLRMAKKKQWEIICQEGSTKRKWEKG